MTIAQEPQALEIKTEVLKGELLNILHDLKSRLLSSERTALSHPDPLARERATGRVQAYRVAIEQLEKPPIGPALPRSWWYR